MIDRPKYLQKPARPPHRNALITPTPVHQLVPATRPQSFSCVDLRFGARALQHLTIRRQDGYQLAQPPTLVFEMLHLRRQRAIILLLPNEIHHLADSSPLADLRHRHAVRALLQNEHLLGVRECLRVHGLLILPSREISAENFNLQ